MLSPNPIHMISYHCPKDQEVLPCQITDQDLKLLRVWDPPCFRWWCECPPAWHASWWQSKYLSQCQHWCVCLDRYEHIHSSLHQPQDWEWPGSSISSVFLLQQRWHSLDQFQPRTVVPAKTAWFVQDDKQYRMARHDGLTFFAEVANNENVRWRWQWRGRRVRQLSELLDPVMRPGLSRGTTPDNSEYQLNTTTRVAEAEV